MITDFLDKYGVDYSTTDRKHGRPGWVQVAECGRCGSSSYHLGIKITLDRANCYKCGGFSVPKLLKELTNAPWPEVYALIGQRAFIRPDSEVSTGGVYAPPTNLMPIADVPAVDIYLKDRGFDVNYLESVWGVRATGPISNHPFRVFIPIYLRKKAVSWTARAACGQEPRYRNAGPKEKIIDEKKLLFGGQFIRDTCIVTEGPFDAMRLGRGAVATLGISYTVQQVNRLADCWKRVIAFDNSVQAQARARQLADQLAVYPGETYVVNLDADDPGSASIAEVKAIRKFVFGER
jgi:hypothetical protein